MIKNRILKITISVFIFFILAVVVAAALQPNQFRIERSVDIKSSSEKVFAEINDLHQWPAWSPWAKADPEMKTDYSGNARGIGAVYSWHGSAKVGAGRMEIMTSLPGKRVDLKIEFFEPFNAENLVEFLIVPNLSPAGAENQVMNTKLTWAMSGPKPFLSRIMGLFMDFDTIIGTDFEKGLNTLKKICENEQSS